MIYLLKNHPLSAKRLPGDWTAHLAEYAARELRLPLSAIRGTELFSASVDARSGDPKILLTFSAETTLPAPGKIAPAEPEELAAFHAPPLPLPDHPALRHPIVVGSGPAGISAALALAMAGTAPLILERGEPVLVRQKKYQDFLRTRILDEESNLLIGEGGAGTFSDGKLHTGTRDPLARFLKEEWVRCGAPPEILWQARPHIGSDRLVPMTENLRRRIETLGGTFRFRACVSDLWVKNGRCQGVILSDGEVIEAPAVLFAPGLGGRELLRKIRRHAAWEWKLFQSGCRIIHPQHWVDRTMYHLPNRPESLGAAEYHLVSRAHQRHVSSFCMCPGGTVVNASAWRGRTISNGMSCFARDGLFANSCLIVTLDPRDFGREEDFFAAFDALETRIFEAGGGDYSLPGQDALNFLSGKPGLRHNAAGCDSGLRSAPLDHLLLPCVREPLAAAVADLERKYPGFAAEGVFAGAESFVSSPIRLLRDRETGASPSLPGFYPVGEGCGLAGGIISAGCDALRVVMQMLTFRTRRNGFADLAGINA